MKQLFFRADEEEEAIAVAAKFGDSLFAIIDKRSARPTARMFVLSSAAALQQMRGSSLWKRMWVSVLMRVGSQMPPISSEG